LAAVGDTKWLSHIRTILSGAVQTVRYLENGHSVMVHCSDGWDRTSQIVALAEIMLDPFYRTIRGFEILLEKDWISYGHKFMDRCGHGTSEDKNYSPVFLQFLDCVWQTLQQYPSAFEFNEKFLVTIADASNSCLFGTFLYNREKERISAKLKERTLSLWTFINRNVEFFSNTIYSPTPVVLIPMDSIVKMQLWTTYYLRFNSKIREQERDYTENRATVDSLVNGFLNQNPATSSVFFDPAEQVAVEDMLKIENDKLKKI